MNLLDRHIFKSVLFTCLGAVGLFSFIVALANFVRDLLGYVLAGQVSPLLLIRLVLLLFPFAVSYALPMGVLTGVLLTLGRLSADSEITAMRAAGIGILRIARPVLILGGLGLVASLYVNFESMPWARVQYHLELAQALRKNPESFIVPKTFIRDFKGRVVYVGEKGTDGSVLKDVWIWELDDQARVRRLVRAESGRLDYDAASNSVVISLYHAKTEERDPEHPEDFSKSPHAPSVDKAEQVRISLDRYLGQDVFHVKPEWLRYAALKAEQQRVAKEPVVPGQEKQHAIAELKLAMIESEKFNLSIAAFAFAFVAVPLGIKVSRRETSANLGVAVLLVLGYYFLITAVKWLDSHPEYRPDVLLWLPNVVFFAFGWWLLRRLRK